MPQRVWVMIETRNGKHLERNINSLELNYLYFDQIHCRDLSFILFLIRDMMT